MSFINVVYDVKIYRVSQEECARLREGVPYVKVYRYNPKHLCPKLNGYGDNGHRKMWSSSGSKHCTCQLTALSMLLRWVWCHMMAIQLTLAINCLCTSFRVMTYFNIRNTLPKSGTFLLGHCVYIIYIYIYIYIYINILIFIVLPCILITLKFLSPTNAPLYYTYKTLKCTVKISHVCAYMFRSTWTETCRGKHEIF